MKNRIVYISLAIMLTLSVGLVGCAGEEVPEITKYTLTISSTEGGQVITPGEGTFTYNDGDVVQLVAKAAEGYQFSGWSGNVDTIGNVHAAMTAITVNGSYSVTANFQRARYTLTISSSPGGSVTTPGQGTFTYDAGTVVTLLAEVEEGYGFAEWTGNLDTISEIMARSTTITMNSHYSIAANFGIAIYDWYGLDAVRDKVWASYVLMNDLDSTTAGYAELASLTANQGKGWEPIGISNYQFGGTLYGHEHKIRSVYIVRPDEDDVGIFSRLAGGLVRDVGVVDIAVTGRSNVGSLVGWNHGIIRNCYSTGTVSGAWNVGGLVGANYRGIIDNCYSSSGATGGRRIGGLVGWNQDSTVSNSYSVGSVAGESCVGGLIGYNQWYSTVSNSHYNYDEVLINGRNLVTCGALFAEDFDEWLANNKSLDVDDRLSQQDGRYLINNISDFKHLLAFGQDSRLRFRLESDLNLATEPGFYVPYLAGDLDGNGHKISSLTVNLPAVSDVGLVGYLAPYGRVRRVAAENISITGDACVGGLVGWNQGNVAGSRASGSVTGSSWVGGLVGSSAGGTLGSCYFTGNVTGNWSAGGLVGEYMTGVVTNSHYKTDDVLINGRNVITIGALFSPEFDQWLANGMSLDVNERLLQEKGYYIIDDVSDFKQLLAFGQDRGLKFRLVQDLDLAAEPGFYIPYLAGEFDGDGHKIRNLTLIFTSTSHVGLFGCLASDAVVRGVGVEDVAVTGQNHVGGLAGFSRGRVSNSYSTGSVIGECNVGGLVGNNEWGGAVSNSYSTARITGSLSVGGLLGRNWHAQLSDCYSTGNVIGQREVGGLVGRNKGTITRSYSTGKVVGVDSAGGLVGEGSTDWFGSGSSSRSFWDLETSGMETSDGGTGKTTAEMKNIATFSAAGWNIVAVANPSTRNPSYIWNIVDGQTYPFLSGSPR